MAAVRQTNRLQITTFGLQRTAGPYKVPCVDGSGLARAFAALVGAAMCSAFLMRFA
jgi:hypothetical protein